MATSTTSTLLAGAFGDCCFSASLKHEGDPVGRVETIAGFQTYVSDPPASTTGSGPKKVILYLVDVYGPFLNSIELLQDFYASNGMVLPGVIIYCFSTDFLRRLLCSGCRLFLRRICQPA